MSSQPIPRVLCVEDDPDIQLVVRMTLESTGELVVETCGSGREALELAPVFAPDLILLDVMMPGLDGPSTLEKLRAIETLRDVPVVFLTAKVQPQEVRRYRALGAVDVIMKPFDPLTLGDQVTAICAATRDSGPRP